MLSILISSRMPQAMLHLQAAINIAHLTLIVYNSRLHIYIEYVQYTTEKLKPVDTGEPVQNAKKEVLFVANKTTLANIDDGVAVFLEKI